MLELGHYYQRNQRGSTRNLNFLLTTTVGCQREGQKDENRVNYCYDWNESWKVWLVVALEYEPLDGKSQLINPFHSLATDSFDKLIEFPLAFQPNFIPIEIKDCLIKVFFLHIELKSQYVLCVIVFGIIDQKFDIIPVDNNLVLAWIAVGLFVYLQ